MQKIRDRLHRLENMGLAEPPHPGIMFCIDGEESDAFEMRIGNEPVTIISRIDGETHEAFEKRAHDALEARAAQQKRGESIPIMMTVRPPVATGEHISPATGAPYTITLGSKHESAEATTGT